MSLEESTDRLFLIEQKGGTTRISGANVEILTEKIILISAAGIISGYLSSLPDNKQIDAQKRILDSISGVLDFINEEVEMGFK